MTPEFSGLKQPFDYANGFCGSCIQTGHSRLGCLCPFKSGASAARVQRLEVTQLLEGSFVHLSGDWLGWPEHRAAEVPDIASLHGMASSHQGSWMSCMEAQGSKQECFNEQGGRCIALYDPDSQVTQCPFRCALLLKALMNLPHSRWRDIGSCLSMGTMSKNWGGSGASF